MKKNSEDKCKCGRGYVNKAGVKTKYASKKVGWHCEKCQEGGK